MPPSWELAWMLGFAAAESLTLLCDGRPPRRQTLAQMAELAEAYMRSPAFLEQVPPVLKLLSAPWWSLLEATHAHKEGLR